MVNRIVFSAIVSLFLATNVSLTFAAGGKPPAIDDFKSIQIEMSEVKKNYPKAWKHIKNRWQKPFKLACHIPANKHDDYITYLMNACPSGKGFADCRDWVYSLFCEPPKFKLVPITN